MWIFYYIVSGEGSYYFNRITFSCTDISFRWIKSVALLGFYFCLKLSFLLNLPDFKSRLMYASFKQLKGKLLKNYWMRN